MTRSRVLIVYYSLEIGGVEKKIVNIIKNLEGSKIEFELALFNKKGHFLEYFPEETLVHDLSKKKSGLGFIEPVFSLAGIIKNGDFTTCFCFGDYPTGFTSLAIFLNRLTYFYKTSPKLVVGVGNIMSKWADYQRLPLVRKLFIRLFYPRADKLVAVSKAAKEDLVKNFSVKENKVVVIYNFVESEALAKKSQVSRGREKTALFAGRFVKQKRLDLLIKAFSKLPDDINARLVLVGEGSEKKHLIKLAKKLGVADKVELKKTTLNVEKHIKKADLAVLASAIEGHPNFALEAMAKGVPVLSTEYPGAEEIITDGVDGFLLSPDPTPREIAKKLEQLLSDEGNLQRVGEKAKDKVKVFSKEKQLKRYKEILTGD